MRLNGRPAVPQLRRRAARAPSPTVPGARGRGRDKGGSLGTNVPQL